MDQLKITLKQLRYFLEVAETRHFRRAAELCGISQPALSAQIQNLESVLGIQLVDRTRDITLPKIAHIIVRQDATYGQHP